MRVQHGTWMTVISNTEFTSACFAFDTVHVAKHLQLRTVMRSALAKTSTSEMRSQAATVQQTIFLHV